MDIKHLGQVFTPYSVVKNMISLRKNKGSVLDPSVGKGAFLSVLEKSAVGIELDKSLITDKKIYNLDFFSYPIKNKFDTIIGNPPYVRFQDMLPSTKRLLNMSLFDRRTNLYLFFIEKCIDHLRERGELIFITPRDFLKSTNSKNLNQKLYNEGSFTYFQELGDAKVFNGYSPNCAVWRWEKGLKNKKLACGKSFNYCKGQIWFSNKTPDINLSEYFNVKVGAVSGADNIFSNSKYANVNMVCSLTRKTREKRKMIYNKKCSYLNQFKSRLLKRKIRTFNEENWWKWGRNYHVQEGERIYVNCKTRQSKPFFVSEDSAYDGSVLALFPKDKTISLSKAESKLNNIDWTALGFVCDGRLIFSQKSLENAPVGEI